MKFKSKHLIYDENYFYVQIAKMKKIQIKDILRNKESYYNEIKISKKNGFRKLSCIKSDSHLYELQKNLNCFFNKIPISNSAFGFVKGYGYKDFLKYHIGKSENKRYYLRIDIKNFFDSINSDLLRRILDVYIEVDEVLKLVTDIVTLNDRLPQGGVNSPILSNIVFRQLDLRIEKYCKKLNFKYSRYADDLLFSSNNEKLLYKRFVRLLEDIISSDEFNFQLNYSKMIKEIEEISLNGFVVGKNIRLSRKRRKDINKILFLYETGADIKDIKEYLARLNKADFNYLRNKKDVNFKTGESLIQFLCGYRSFLIDWSLDENKNYYNKHQSLIRRVENLIDNIIELQSN
ncbi:reverse transcriptase family protein [Natroniella acetigena]|uniref:reverse transcriptase family protein n=1 Tax=Natroniella acetigena TaxID=52004 RepID=UPI002009EE74|nr:reverse transcriptase family protein [Natroniella acetigena]MCK8828569.1 reverse transcriptase family protein [Natroniella acetigena]